MWWRRGQLKTRIMANATEYPGGGAFPEFIELREDVGIMNVPFFVLSSVGQVGGRLLLPAFVVEHLGKISMPAATSSRATPGAAAGSACSSMESSIRCYD